MSWQELPLGRVFFDSVTGVPGTTWPIGTPTVPSDVIADVIAICAARNIANINVHGALILGAAMEHYCFFGNCHASITDVITLGGFDVDSSRFDCLVITGAQGGTGYATYLDSILYAVTGFRGVASNCCLHTSIALAVGGLTDYADFIRCHSIQGGVTVTVGAPDIVSFKDFIGSMVLTVQTAGAVLLTGYKGDLEIDAMDGGTLDIYANGADITINANCAAPSVITIYGNARVTIVAGNTATVNDYTKETQLDTIEASAGRALLTMDFWSEGLEEVQIGDGAAGATVLLPDITVADLPGGATIVRAIVMFKFRMIENKYQGANKLQAATAPLTSQVIQIRSSAPLDYVDAINFVDDFFTLADSVREGGDVIVGTLDVSGATGVDEEDTYNLRWLLARADADFINFNDVQVGLRIWYSV